MIDKKKVQHIAKLARIGLTEAEIKKFQKELSSILDYFNSLKEIDVSGVDLTFHPTENFLENKNEIMRIDKARPQPNQVVNNLVEAAPQRKKGYIKVKAVF